MKKKKSSQEVRDPNRNRKWSVCEEPEYAFSPPYSRVWLIHLEVELTCYPNVISRKWVTPPPHTHTHAVCGRALYFFHTVSRCPHVTQQTYYCIWSEAIFLLLVKLAVKHLKRFCISSIFRRNKTPLRLEVLTAQNPNPETRKFMCFPSLAVWTEHTNELIPQLQIRQEALLTPLEYSASQMKCRQFLRVIFLCCGCFPPKRC